MKQNDSDYQKYLQSDHWLKISEETKRLAGYKCQVCNSSDQLHTHHRTYERKGDELQADLVCLCASCHKLFHNVDEAARVKELEFRSRQLGTLHGIIMSFPKDLFLPEIYARLDKLLGLTHCVCKSPRLNENNICVNCGCVKVAE